MRELPKPNIICLDFDCTRVYLHKEDENNHFQIEVIEFTSDNTNNKILLSRVLSPDEGWMLIDSLIASLPPRELDGEVDFDSYGALVDILRKGHKFKASEAEALSRHWFSIHSAIPAK